MRERNGNFIFGAVPQIFDLWADPQERYDLFMNNFTEKTWTLPTMGQAMAKKMKTYAEYPPRKPQSDVYSGPVLLSDYFRFEEIREQLKKEGITIPMHTGN